MLFNEESENRKYFQFMSVLGNVTILAMDLEKAMKNHLFIGILEKSIASLLFFLAHGGDLM